MAEGQASRVVGRSNIGFHEKDTSPFEYFDLSLVILPQIVGGAYVEMTGHSNGFENIDVVHRWVRLVRLRGHLALWLRWFRRDSRTRFVRLRPLTRPSARRFRPLSRIAFIEVGGSGACRAVAREERAVGLGSVRLRCATARRFRPLSGSRLSGWANAGPAAL
jgi:hypothetical protein